MTLLDAVTIQPKGAFLQSAKGGAAEVAMKGILLGSSAAAALTAALSFGSALNLDSLADSGRALSSFDGRDTVLERAILGRLSLKYTLVGSLSPVGAFVRQNPTLFDGLEILPQLIDRVFGDVRRTLEYRVQTEESDRHLLVKIWSGIDNFDRLFSLDKALFDLVEADSALVDAMQLVVISQG